MSAVTLSSIAKSFGTTRVLKGVTLDIRDGEFLTLVGPSGCGKSTLLRIIAGLELQDDGTVQIGGRVVDGVRPKARDIAMVFQTYALYPHMTVEQNLAVPLVMRRLSGWQRLPLLGRLLPGTRAVRAAIASDVRDVARALDIDTLLDRKPAQLSGGQRQRVALGRAIVRRPSVFLMDEPLSNLDAKLRVQMRSEIKELHARLGITFVYVTHDQSEAMTMSDRVALMIDGDLVQVGPPHALYDDPDDVRVASFIGSPQINLVPAPILGECVLAPSALGIGAPPGHVNGLTVGIRPQALALAATAGSDVISGRVRMMEHLGVDLFVHVDIAGAQQPLIARVAPKDGNGLRPGSSIGLRPDPDAMLAFDASGRRVRQRAPDVVVPLRDRVAP